MSLDALVNRFVVPPVWGVAAGVALGLWAGGPKAGASDGDPWPSAAVADLVDLVEARTEGGSPGSARAIRGIARVRRSLHGPRQERALGRFEVEARVERAVAGLAREDPEVEAALAGVVERSAEALAVDLAALEGSRREWDGPATSSGLHAAFLRAEHARIAALQADRLDLRAIRRVARRLFRDVYSALRADGAPDGVDVMLLDPASPVARRVRATARPASVPTPGSAVVRTEVEDDSAGPRDALGTWYAVSISSVASADAVVTEEILVESVCTALQPPVEARWRGNREHPDSSGPGAVEVRLLLPAVGIMEGRVDGAAFLETAGFCGPRPYTWRVRGRFMVKW